MPSRFSVFEKRLSRSVDHTYSETTRIVPMARGKLSTSADPDRQPYEIVGIVDLSPMVVGARASSRYVADSGSVTADKIHVSYSEQLLPVNRALWPRKDDEIECDDRPDPIRLKVEVAEPDGLGRMIVKCTRMKVT